MEGLQQNESPALQQPPEERVAYAPETLPFDTPRGFDYLRRHFFSRVLTFLVRLVADPLLILINGVWLGFRVHGLKNRRSIRGRGAVSVCNHVHPMDCTMIDLVMHRRIYYVSLEENFRIPGVRRLIRVLGAAPLSHNPHCMKELFSAMEQALKGNAVVQIYPEGLLHPYCDRLRPFKNGAFRLAATARAPILPMVFTYRKAWGLRRLFTKKPTLHLHILPAVFPEKNESVRDMTVRMKAACIEEMTEKQLEEAAKRES